MTVVESATPAVATNCKTTDRVYFKNAKRPFFTGN